MALTHSDVVRLRDLLGASFSPDLSVANRGGFYLEYYELIRNAEPEGAKQVLLQAHITTYSGFIGGAALIGNALAKFAKTDLYPETLDEFSWDIANGLLEYIEAQVAAGETGVIDADTLQGLDRGVWNEKGLGEYFPGNIQLYDDNINELFTAGSIGGAMTGFQLMFGSRVGFEASNFPYEVDTSHSDYDVIRDTDPSRWNPDTETFPVLFVRAKNGSLDGAEVIPPEWAQEEPGLAVLAGALSAAIGLGPIAPLALSFANLAVLNASWTLLTNAWDSLFEDSTLDNTLRDEFAKYVGAGGQAVDPDSSIPGQVAWNDFPVILRNEGNFHDGEESHIIFGYDTATVDGGAGEELMFGFSSAHVSGGADDDLIFGKDDTVLSGDDGDDTIVSKGYAKAYGGSGEDLLFSFDESEVFGGSGNDVIFGLGTGNLDGGSGDDHILLIEPALNDFGEKVSLNGGDGNDIIVSLGGVGANLEGGAGDDWLVSFGGESTLKGGAGSDVLVASDGYLYGGSGSETDYFIGGAGTVIADADANDHTFWGGLELTGGVQQEWMEAGYAYWAPISTFISTLPGTLSGLFGAIVSLKIDTSFMLTFRYWISQENHLVIELGRKNGEQRMILEDYDIDLQSGASSGNVSVFRLEYVPNAYISDLIDLINLASYAVFGSGLPGKDPLVIDLDGDGIELTSLGRSSTYFELDGDGFAERTAWVRPDDGFLAIDDNGNGTIDDLGELFGDATTSGFTELAGFDSNADGVIDANDARFAELLVWQDINGNGVSEAGELRTLTEAGITSISLTTRTPTDTDIRGNEIRAEADIAFADGSQSTISDVVLISDQTDTKTLGDTTISTAAQALPELRGYGELTDLRVAMTDNAALLAAVHEFAATTASGDLSSYHSDVIDILFEWAGVSAVAADPLGASFDVQKLAFLEKYTGYEIMDRDANGDPLLTNIDEVLDIWDNTLQETTMRLAVQGPLSAHFAGTSFDSGRDGFMADTAQGLADIYQAILAQLPADPALALAEWNADWAPLLGQFSGSFLRFDGNGLRADFHVASLVRAFDAASPSIGLQDLIDSLPYEADQLAGIYLGTAGDDSLSRQTDIRTSVYVGGAGNDTYTGGLAQDVYVFGTGFGDDLIIDQEASGAESGDRIRFTTLNSADVTFARDGEDLVLTVNGTSDRITIRKQYSAPEITLAGQYATANWGVEDIQFADGEIFEVADIAERIGTGTGASEVIEGTARGDQITGLEGDDTLRGGNNGDIYYFSRGHGNDVIEDNMTNTLLSAPDALIFEGGIREENVAFSRDGNSNDLLLTLDEGGGSILIKDQFYYTPLGYQNKYAIDYRVDSVFFSQGLPLTWLQIQEKLINEATTAGDDTIYGFGTADTFKASAGNDHLLGGDGGDIYHFGLGSGVDIIEDNQRFVEFNLFPGIETFGFEADDELVFGEGISASDVIFTRQGNASDLIITLADSGDQVTIKGYFNATYTWVFGTHWFNRIETLSFADGTTITVTDIVASVLDQVQTDGDDVVYGFSLEDTLDGGLGDDYLSGGNENDVYKFDAGYGHDTIWENLTNIFSGGTDKVVFGAGISAAGTHFNRDADGNLEVTFDGLTDKLTVQGQFSFTETGPFGTQNFGLIETFEFHDGTIVNWEQIQLGILAAQKTDGNDEIVGFHFDDVIEGGLGDDTLKGGNGNDTYIYRAGDGNDTIDDGLFNILTGRHDILDFVDLNSTDVVFSRDASSWSLKIDIPSTGHTITVDRMFPSLNIARYFYAVDEFRFADGVSYSREQVMQMLLDDASTSGNDTIYGFHDDETIDGGAGDDLLIGLSGQDTYVWGVGSGNDIIDDQSSYVRDDNIVAFTGSLTASDLTFERIADTNDLKITIIATGETLTVKKGFNIHPFGYLDFGVHTYTFTDGSSLTYDEIGQMLVDAQATAGNDTITGFGFDDEFDGGAGNDLLIGGEGSDVYIFGVGSGFDSASDINGRLTDPIDQVRIVGGLTAADIGISRDGNDLLIDLVASNDRMRVIDQFAGDYRIGIEEIVFDDGSTISAEELALMVANLTGTAGADTLAGSDLADAIDGLDGDDSLTGNDGSDFLLGGAGNDTIDAGYDEDHLTGGLGDDLLIGRDGSDTYIFHRGDGQDTIQDDTHFYFFEYTDRLEIHGYQPDDIIVTRAAVDSNDIILTFVGTTDRITLVGSLGTAGYDDIEEIVIFSDGTAPDGSPIVVETVWTNAELRARILSDATTSGDDLIVGLKSDDVLVGAEGNDTLTGSHGEDTLTGGVGNDRLEGRDGSDTYIFHRGDGQDVIEDNTHNYFIEYIDRLEIHGYQPDDISMARTAPDSNDVILSFAGTDDSITLVGSLGTGGYDDIEEIVIFTTIEAEDGSTTVVETLWTNAEIRARILAEAVTPGHDHIVGLTSDDNLDGGAGNDTITGARGEDTLAGGAGNDRLEGNDGSDLYVFSRGDGQDVIEDNTHNYFIGYTDRLQIHDYLPSELVLARDPDNVHTLIITFTGTDDQVTLINGLTTGGFDDIEEIAFDDGTVWTMDAVRDMLRAAASTAGDDTIVGFDADGVFDAGDGNDVILSGEGDDTLSGGLGDDTLHGGHDGDTYIFNRGDGSDTIEDDGNHGTDRLEIRGYTPAEVNLSGVAGSGSLLVITFTGTDDQIAIRNTLNDGQFDVIEEIAFDDGTVWSINDVLALLAAGDPGTILGSDIDDSLTGSSGDDVFQGGLGNDSLYGGAGSDQYIYAAGDGSDFVDEEDASTVSVDVLTLIGLNPSDILASREGNDFVITVISTGERIELDEQFYSTTDHWGIEEVHFADGTVWDRQQIKAEAALRGDDAANSITGWTEDNLFVGGLGDDTLHGKQGNDTYIYSSGDGSDVVDDQDASTVSVDVLQFTDINASDVAGSRIDTDFFLTILATGDRIELDSQFYSTTDHWGIEEIRFADGEIWDRQRMRQEGAAYGDSGANTLAGTGGDDIFIGGLAADSLDGGAGSDTYIYASGDGNDFIDDEDASTTDLDILRLTDINAADVLGTRTGDDLFLTIVATGDQIQVDDQFYSTTAGWGLEEIHFADGEIWDRTRIRQEGVYRGDDGVNSIQGTSGDDTFYGGRGADNLYGKTGSDTYIYSSGDGSDFIDEQDASTVSVDILRLTDINASGVQGSRIDTDFFLTILATGDRIEFDAQLYSTTDHWGLEEVHFADGEIWDRARIRQEAVYRGDDGVNSIHGTSDDEIFNGGLGDDNLYGKTGSDTYIYSSGDGSDFIDEQDGSTVSVDILRLTDINASGVQGSRIDTDFFLTILATGHRIEFDAQLYSTTAHWGLEEVHFADGEIWDRARIRQEAVIRGDDGANSLYGTGGDDIYEGGLGDDNLYGKAGSDTYIYSSGDGSDWLDEQDASTVSVDILRLTDINASGVQGSRIDTDFFLTILATGDRIEFDAQFYSTTDHWGIEEVHFADGEIWDRARIRAEGVIRGDDGNNSLYGTGGDDVYAGGLGNDNLYGAGGADTYIYASGDGNDWLDEEGPSTSETDVLKLTDLNQDDIYLTRSGDDLMVNIIATGEHVEVDQHYWNTTDHYGIEEIHFADGTVWDRVAFEDRLNDNYLVGTAGADTLDGGIGDDRLLGEGGADSLIGGDGNDRLTGGLGDDILQGDAGSDTFVFGASETGTDQILDFTAGAATDDVIEFDSATFANFAEVYAAATDDGTDTTIVVDASHSIVLNGVLTGQLHDDDFIFV